MKVHLAILGFAMGALQRRRGRSVALVVGLGLVCGLFASGQLITTSLRTQVETSADVLPDLTVQRLVAGRPALIRADAIDALASDPGVRAVSPRVWGYVFFPALEANVVVMGVDDMDDPGAARVGSELATRLGLREGDRLAVPAAPESVVLVVQSIAGSATAFHDADVLFVAQSTARVLLQVPAGDAVDIAVSLTTADEAGVVSERLTTLMPGARVLSRTAMLRAYELTFDGRGGLLAVLLLPCLGGLLLLAWDRLTGLGADERREIGIMKAIGWQTHHVLLARIYETLVVAVSGAALGLLGAYLYVFVLGAPGLASALFGWSTLHAPLDLVPAFGATDVLVAFAAVVAPFVGLSVVPAWRAAIEDPDRAARGT